MELHVDTLELIIKEYSNYADIRAFVEIYGTMESGGSTPIPNFISLCISLKTSNYKGFWVRLWIRTPFLRPFCRFTHK